MAVQWRMFVGFVLTEAELNLAEAGMCRSAGHCAVMGTASSMACMVEALGISLPENAAIPAADAEPQSTCAIIRSTHSGNGKRRS